MNDERHERAKRADDISPDGKPRARSTTKGESSEAALPCWPFPVGSQNDTDKAVKLKPYVPPKRRTLNQY